jgi:hypothetical protein
MEGLIPLVYKAFMKKKTRSQYECLSSGAARGYNISDFYVHEAPKSELHLEPSMEKKTYQKKVIRDIFLFMEISQVDFRRWQIAQQLLLLLKQRDL